jgi:sigma-B regulation protein RsbU (phosphoserine phosphatase)
VTRKNNVASIEATGLPVGIFGHEKYSSIEVKLEAGDSLLLYTDGLTEARDKSETEYGIERLSRLMSNCVSFAPQALAVACLEDARSFCGGHPRADDLTIMVIQRAH